MTGRVRLERATYRADDDYTLTRYDGRGCGLSAQNPSSLTFDDLVADLEAVVEAAGLKQFILLGCCQGGPWRLLTRLVIRGA